MTGLFLAVIFAPAVAAQEIPAEMLQLDHQRCMKDCQEVVQEGGVCKQLCDCTVDRFQKTFTFPEYLKISGEIAEGKVSKQSQKRLTDTANYCAARIKWPDEEEAGEPTTSTGSPKE